jgi:outer membrane protein assembly factor BamB
MQTYPALGRFVAGIVTCAVLTAAVVFAMSGGEGKEAVTAKVESTADNWVMFGGNIDRNFVNTKVKGLPAEWDVGDKKNILWVADLGSKAYGGPIVAGGKVFVGTNNQKPRQTSIKVNGKDVSLLTKDEKGKTVPVDMGVLMCFDAKDGAFQWQHLYFKLESGLVNDWPKEGICSSPVVEGDKLYYVSNRCEVVCAGLDGKIHWKLDMIGELGVFPHNLAVCSPLLVGNDLWVVTANGVHQDHISVPAPRAPSFIRVDKNKGKVTWQDNTPTASLVRAGKGGGGKLEKEFFKSLVNRGMLIQHGQWSNPAYAVVDGQPQVVFPGGDGWIYSFDPKAGKLLWKFDCNPKSAKYELAGRGQRSDFIATPVIYKNRVYIGTGQDPEHESGVGHLWCIDMTKRGDVSPELVTDASMFPPKTKKNPDSAMVWHYGGPVAPKDRGKINSNYYFGRTMSSCAIHDDLVYVGELLGTVHCLDANTGQAYWRHETGAASWSSTYWADGKVYFGNDDGTVTVFAHGKKLKVLAENSMGSAVRASPVAANGTLYVMTENKLYAIAEKK